MVPASIRRLSNALALIGLLTIAPGSAVAQSGAAAASGDTPRINKGQTLWVTTADGRTDRGVVRSLSATSFDLRLKDETRTFRFDEVSRIQRKDSSMDGALIGLAAGAGAGALAFQGLKDWLGGGFVGLMAAAGGAAGLLIGLMMDNSREGRVLVYERKPPARAIILAPLVSKSGVGLGMSIRW